MRRVRASIKVGRRGKRNKGTKSIQGGGAPRGAGLRPGRVSPGQESPVPETQELHRPSLGKGARRELEQDTGGRGCPRAPRDSNRQLRPGECAELPKGCSAGGGTRRDPEQLGGLRRRLRGGGCGAGARIQQRRPRSTGRRDTAQDPDNYIYNDIKRRKYLEINLNK